MSPVGLSPTRGVPFALSGKDSGTGALYGLTGANAQASCSRTRAACVEAIFRPM